ncbi:MAG: hypothetical protein M3Z21_12300 [Pseudomonadota bacterium]|nr:hypothetical protein [Pseudomonadota bacterium]
MDFFPPLQTASLRKPENATKRRGGSPGSVGSLLLFLSVACLAGEAAAQIRAAFVTPPPSPRPAGLTISAVPGCPDQGGVLNSISVPVGEPLSLMVRTARPAPAGGARFLIGSTNRSIVAAGDPRQGFLPEVIVPEGELRSNTFDVFGIRVGRTTLQATALTGGFNDIFVPIGAWDVGLDSGEKFLDANRPGSHCRASDDSAELSTNEAMLAACGAAAKGMVTDGVSRLLLRTRAGLPGTACYEVVSTAASDQGRIDPAVKTTTAVGGINQASAYHRAPQSFEDSGGSRRVEVEFTFTPSIGNGNTTRIRASTTLVRPPLVLVHGIWSNGDVWPPFFMRDDETHTTVAGDYGNSNDAGFSANVPRVREFIAEAVDISRGDGYATTQADVIAHSMGGLLSRLYAQEPQYRRPDNLNAGDIRRLLTLDTPHLGSNFANLVVALHDAEPEQTEATIARIIPGGAEVTNGAVCDLAENSPVLSRLAGGTTLSAHAITATGGPTGSETAPAPYWGGVLGFSSFEAALTKTECARRERRGRASICVETRHLFPQDIVDGHRFREPNDAIVPVSSQRGGFAATSAAVDNFPNLLHFGASFVAGVTNRQVVAERAFTLLDQPADAPAWAGGFPGVPADATGAPRTVPGIPGDQDAQVYSRQCASGGPMQPAAAQSARQTLLVARTAGDPRARVIQPVEGQVFAPGDTVHVMVATEVFANDIRVGLLGLGEFEGTNYDGSTYEVSFTLLEALAGPIIIIPSITDQAGNRIQGRPVTIAVRPDVPPERIHLVQRRHLLDLLQGESRQLRVRGIYPGGIDRIITSAAAGTIYRSSNPGVVSVDADGTVTPVGLGAAVVTVENMGVIDFATIRVRQGDQPLPPTNITNELTLQRSGLRLNRHSGFFVQQVRITNDGDIPVIGPLFLVVSDLPPGVEMISKTGDTRAVEPVGSPYLRLPAPATDGSNLWPGESVEVVLEFLNPNRRGISYDVAVVRTSEQP